MAIFKSTDNVEHQHIYGMILDRGEIDPNSSQKGFTVYKRGSGHYTVQFELPFKEDPGVNCTLYTQMQGPYIGANAVHIINVDSRGFTYTTMRGDNLYDSGVTFTAFGEV